MMLLYFQSCGESVKAKKPQDQGYTKTKIRDWRQESSLCPEFW
jgi:hypothetical protein